MCRLESCISNISFYPLQMCVTLDFVMYGLLCVLVKAEVSTASLLVTYGLCVVGFTNKTGAWIACCLACLCGLINESLLYLIVLKCHPWENNSASPQSEVSLLRGEVAQLKTLLLAHQDCPITLQQKSQGQLALHTSKVVIIICWHESICPNHSLINYICKVEIENTFVSIPDKVMNTLCSYIRGHNKYSLFRYQVKAVNTLWSCVDESDNLYIKKNNLICNHKFIYL